MMDQKLKTGIFLLMGGTALYLFFIEKVSGISQAVVIGILIGSVLALRRIDL